jgi:hypothetical protein
MIEATVPIWLSITSYGNWRLTRHDGGQCFFFDRVGKSGGGLLVCESFWLKYMALK